MKRNSTRNILLILLLALLFAVPAYASGSREATVRAIVLYSEGAEQMEDALREVSTVLWRYENIFSGAAVETTADGLRALKALDGVAEVRPVRSYEPAGSGINGELSSDDALALMGDGQLWKEGYTGDGVVIAVLDSGLNTGHEVFADASLMKSPALSRSDVTAFAGRGRTAGAYISERIPFVYDYYSRDTDVSTREGHGTHVAALAAGYNGSSFRGAAPGAQILGMKVFPDDSGGNTDDALILRALEDAWNLGADVVNISVGTGAGFSRDSILDGLFCKAFAQMAEDGVIICCSAGNEGTNAVYKTWAQQLPTGGYTDYGTVTSPGSYRGAVPIAAAAAWNGETTVAGYSSWGPASDLHMDPALTVFGGPVASAGANSEDYYYSDYGTSMASGSASGLFAVTLQALRERGVTDKAETARLAKSLLESTARVLTGERDVPLSPRKQGTGLADLDAALSSELAVVDPLIELGDSETGKFTLTLTLRNLSQKAAAVSLDVQVLTDGYVSDNSGYYSTLTPQDITDGMEIAGIRPVTVPAGETAEVKLELAVGEKLRNEMAKAFPNGFFVEGFVTASGGGQKAHGAFLGYCGDWTAAPVLDAPDFRDLQNAAFRLSGSSGFENPLQNPTKFFSGLEVELGANLAYLTARGSSDIRDGRLLGSNGHAFVAHDDDRNAIPGQGTDAMRGMDRQLGLELCTLRDAAGVVMLVSDQDTGEIYAATADAWLKKSTMDIFVGRVNASTRFFWNGTDAKGAALPGGTRVRVDVYAWLEAGDAIQTEFDRRIRSQSPESYGWMLDKKYGAYRAFSFPAVIDSQSPVMTAAALEGGKSLVLTFQDDRYLAYASLTDGSGRVLADEVFASGKAGDACTLTADVSAWSRMPDVLYVTAEDYASNTTGYELDLKALAAGGKTAFRPSALHLLTDVGSGSWYRDAVNYAVTQGLMDCDGEGRFRPAWNASRMEVVSALYRANGCPDPGMSAEDLPFTDVGNLTDCLDALCWAYKKGIVSGRSDGTFDGAAGVTRQELAVMLYHGVKQVSGPVKFSFSDAGDIADWAKDAMAWAAGRGFLQGSGGRLFPAADITRGELAQILKRYLES